MRKIRRFFIQQNYFRTKFMDNSSIKAFCIVAVILLSAFCETIAQQRTGNIVEIFGRHRVETTSEGVIIHEFTEGYALRNAMRPGMLTGMQDIVFWQLATERFQRPYAGKVLADNYLANPEPLQWQRIEVDTAGVFTGDLGKARFDAETFLYRGNSSVDIIPDTLFSLVAYPERNVIIYGNADNHRAWQALLPDAPVQVHRDYIRFGNRRLEGDDLGTFYLYPRRDSPTAAIGVVAGTGQQGMKALFANDYFSGITGFPDLLIFTTDWIKDGVDGLKVSGFFGNDWSVENGDFFIK